MELRSCYFCGSTGRTLATRELVSDGDDGEPVGVVLCPDCDEKLDRLLARVLGRTREGAGAGVPSESGTTDPDAAGDGLDFSSEITFDEGGADDGGDDREDGDDAAEPAGDSADVDVIGGSTAAGEDGLTRVGTPSDDPADDESPLAHDGAVDEDATDDADRGTADDASEGESDGGSSGTLRGLGESSASTYRKALRLLRNREFPMARSDLVEVLSSAYDLDYDECQRLVDLAVEQDLLVEDGDELRRG